MNALPAVPRPPSDPPNVVLPPELRAFVSELIAVYFTEARPQLPTQADRFHLLGSQHHRLVDELRALGGRSGPVREAFGRSAARMALTLMDLAAAADGLPDVPMDVPPHRLVHVDPPSGPGNSGVLVLGRLNGPAPRLASVRTDWIDVRPTLPSAGVSR